MVVNSSKHERMRAGFHLKPSSKPEGAAAYASFSLATQVITSNTSPRKRVIQALGSRSECIKMFWSLFLLFRISVFVYSLVLAPLCLCFWFHRWSEPYQVLSQVMCAAKRCMFCEQFYRKTRMLVTKVMNLRNFRNSLSQNLWSRFSKKKKKRKKTSHIISFKWQAAVLSRQTDLECWSK